ncbi:hypothetical protein JXQ70_18000 [bacterium]|nr:hypothetical protein [bacterium]
MSNPHLEAVHKMAERFGGASAKLKERLKHQQTQMKAIRKALADGPKTVVELAEIMKIHSNEALWLLMALKKYGKVVEHEQQGEAYTYALKA